MIRSIVPVFICLHLIFLPLISKAQYYKHKLDKKLYQPLTTYTEYPFTLPWDEEQINLPIGFDFKIYGETYDSLIWGNGRINLKRNIEIPVADGDTICRIHVYNLDLKDAGTTSSVSSVRYHTEGVAGNRIFCLEVNNALPVGSTSTLDFQVRLFETTNEITIHYNDVQNANAFLPGNLKYRIGIGKLLTGSHEIDGFGLHGTSWDVYSAKENSLEAYLWQQVYDSLLVTITDRENFYFSNFPENLNIKIINERSTAIFLFKSEGLPLGMNHYLDKGISSKYKFENPVYMKGVSFQCFGEMIENFDSLTVLVNKIGADNFPSETLTETKVSMSCLDLTGKLNVLAFDQQVLIDDSCMISFIFPDYSYPYESAFYFYWKIGYDDSLFNPYTTNVLMANDKWYSTILDRTTSERFADSDPAQDSLNLSIFPIVNNYFNNDKPVTETIECSTLNTNQGSSQTSDFNIFPNPIKENETLKISAKDIISSIEIISLNSSSTIIKIQPESLGGINSFEIPDLPVGLYLIRITSEGKNYSSKLIVIK